MEFKNQNTKKKPNRFGHNSGLSSKVARKEQSLNWFDEDWSDLVSSVQKDPKNKANHNKINELKSTVSKNLLRGKKIIIKLLKKFNNKKYPKKVLLYSKSHKKISGLVLIVFIFLSVGLFKLTDSNDQKSIAGASVTSSPKSSADLPREKPSFKILYPGSKDESSVGELVKVSPPTSAAVYTYIDKIGEVQLNISQQELPQNFKLNQEGELQKLAESFQANDVIQVDGVRVYHGSSASGVQSLIFIKGNLLITIRSSQNITDETWAAYISALHS